MFIQDSRSIKDIQEEFHQIFPGLKMVFYQTQHGEHEGSEKEMEYASDHKLSDIRVLQTEGNIEILPDMTVRELEQAFEKLFGLHIQIFRQSGAVWLQTIHTDDWTLTKQNEKGIETIHR